MDEVAPLLDAAERASGARLLSRSSLVRAAVRSLLADIPAASRPTVAYLAPIRGDADATAAFAARALDEVGEGEWGRRSPIQGFLAVALRLRGGSPTPNVSCVRHRGMGAAEQHTVTAWGCYPLGQAQRGQGRLDAAAQTFQQALDDTAVPGRPLPAAGPA